MTFTELEAAYVRERERRFALAAIAYNKTTPAERIAAARLVVGRWIGSFGALVAGYAIYSECPRLTKKHTP